MSNDCSGFYVICWGAWKRVYLCHSDLAVNGQEQIGPLSLVNAGSPRFLSLYLLEIQPLVRVGGAQPTKSTHSLRTALLKLTEQLRAILGFVDFNPGLEASLNRACGDGEDAGKIGCDRINRCN